LPGSPGVADRAQNLPGPAPDSVLRVLQISFGGVIDERVNKRALK